MQHTNNTTTQVRSASMRRRDLAMVGDGLKKYFSDIGRYPLLSREEEYELAVRQKTGDEAAGRRLAQCNLKLVVKIAQEHRSWKIPLLDLIQEGNLGLLKAIEKFDPERGLRLSSCARWWIRAHVLKHLMDNHRLIRVGTTQAQRKLFFNLRKAHKHFKSLGVEATPERIAQHLEVKARDVCEMEQRMFNQELSLNAPLRGEDESIGMIDVLPSPGESAERSIARQQMQRLLAERLKRFGDKLEGRDVDIWERRLLSEDPLTLQELGQRFGVSRERARQLEARLTSKLSQYLGRELRGLGVEEVSFPVYH